MTRQPHNRYSMDGFVPSGQGRHVGFDGPRPQPGNTAAHRLRTKRPGMPVTPVQPTPQAQGPGIDKRRHAANAQNSFADFNTYSTAGPNPVQPVPPTTRRRKRDARAAGPKKLSWFRRVSWKKVFKRTVAVATVFALLAGGWLGYKFLNNTSKVFGGDANVLGFLNSTKLRGEDKGEVNILLAGVSTDDPDHAGASLADSIMLISLDTKNNKAMMMSVPRDLWVDIPGYGHSKINAANAYGDQDNFSEAGLPPAGMGLLAKTINETFEMPVHYYARVNYSAFRDAVNAVDGIEVDIKSSDPRGLYDPNIAKVDGGPLKLPNGKQKLDGQTALNLARARGNPTYDGRYPYGFERSDFTRTQHQRMMMIALKERVASSSTLSNPLKIGQLFDVVGKNVKTDFQPSEIRRLYDLNKQIPSNSIASVSLNDIGGKNYLASYRSADGASALIPAAGIDDFSDIQVALKKISSSDPVVRESAKVVILNGGDITGLASKESNNLTSKGLNVVAIGDAPRQPGANVVIDRTGGKMPGSKQRLMQLYKAAEVSNDAVGYPSADLIVILGTDHRLQSDAAETE